MRLCRPPGAKPVGAPDEKGVEFVRDRVFAVDEFDVCWVVELCRSLDTRGIDDGLELDPLAPVVDACLLDA